jgi:carbamoyltransferase
LLCFVRSQIDTLVIEEFLIDRASLPASWSVFFTATAEPTVHGISHEVYTFI